MDNVSNTTASNVQPPSVSTTDTNCLSCGSSVPSGPVVIGDSFQGGNLSDLSSAHLSPIEAQVQAIVEKFQQMVVSLLQSIVQQLVSAFSGIIPGIDPNAPKTPSELPVDAEIPKTPVEGGDTGDSGDVRVGIPKGEDGSSPKETTGDTKKPDTETKAPDKSPSDSSKLKKESPKVDKEKEKTDTTPRLPFKDKMKEILSDKLGGRLNEAELRAAVVRFQLYQKDPKLEEAFKKDYAQAMNYGATEDVAVKMALSKAEQEGKLNMKDAEWVNGLSFRAAQLDDKHSSLSREVDGQMDFDSALQIAEATLAGIQSGGIAAQSRSLTK